MQVIVVTIGQVIMWFRWSLFPMGPCCGGSDAVLSLMLMMMIPKVFLDVLPIGRASNHVVPMLVIPIGIYHVRERERERPRNYNYGLGITSKMVARIGNTNINIKRPLRNHKCKCFL